MVCIFFNSGRYGIEYARSVSHYNMLGCIPWTDHELMSMVNRLKIPRRPNNTRTKTGLLKFINAIINNYNYFA